MLPPWGKVSRCFRNCCLQFMRDVLYSVGITYTLWMLVASYPYCFYVPAYVGYVFWLCCFVKLHHFFLFIHPCDRWLFVLTFPYLSQDVVPQNSPKEWHQHRSWGASEPGMIRNSYELMIGTAELFGWLSHLS